MNSAKCSRTSSGKRTVAEFPEIASKVWSQRHVDADVMIKKLNTRLEEQRKLKGALLRAKLLGEVSQADYVQGNSDLDDEIDAIKQQLNGNHTQRGTLDAFLRFSKLMLVDIAAAWQLARIEQRVSVQNFLFQGGITYDRDRKFLNTTNVTLFQQLRGLAHCKGGGGVPDGI